MKIVKSIYNFLKSVKLAVYILTILTIFTLLASLIPLELESGYYLERYGLLGRLIVLSGFHNFFRSGPFFILMMLFMINLSLCTFHRIKGHYRRGKVKNVGPDIIHIGIIVIVLGGTLSLFTRGEQFKWFAQGDNFQLYDRYELKVAAVEFIKYPDGRPKDWITHIELREGDGAIKAVSIEVNGPLKVGNLTIYQNSYNEQHALRLADAEGKEFTLKSKDIVPIGGVDHLFKGIDSIRADEADYEELVFLRRVGGGSLGTDYERVSFRPDEMIGSYKVVDYRSQLHTGLNFVRDGGLIPVWAGIILVLLGVCWTYTIKLGEMKDDSN